MDETLFSDIENALHTSDFQVVGEDVIAAVEAAFVSTKICVESMADEFLSVLQKNGEFDLFFREEASSFAQLKRSCVDAWRRELSVRETEVARHLITYFDSKLARHSHRVINIKNAMSGKVMRLRESVIQYRVDHELRSDERIREHNRLVVELVRNEKDAEIAQLKARIETLEDRLKTAQVSRLSDPSYRHLITDRQASLDRAAFNVEETIEAITAHRLRSKPCDGCAALQERVDDLERMAAMNDASSQESSCVANVNSSRIVRPSQIAMSKRAYVTASDDDDDDDSTVADSVSVMSDKSNKMRHKEENRQGNGLVNQNQRMSRVSMIKVPGGKATASSTGGAAFRGRQRTEITPIRGGQRSSVAEGGSVAPLMRDAALKEEDEEEEENAAGRTVALEGHSDLAAPYSQESVASISPGSVVVEVATSVVAESYPTTSPEEENRATDSPEAMSDSKLNANDVQVMDAKPILENEPTDDLVPIENIVPIKKSARAARTTIVQKHPGGLAIKNSPIEETLSYGTHQSKPDIAINHGRPHGNEPIESAVSAICVEKFSYEAAVVVSPDTEIGTSAEPSHRKELANKSETEISLPEKVNEKRNIELGVQNPCELNSGKHVTNRSKQNEKLQEKLEEPHDIHNELLDKHDKYEKQLESHGRHQIPPAKQNQQHNNKQQDSGHEKVNSKSHHIDSQDATDHNQHQGKLKNTPKKPKHQSVECQTDIVEAVATPVAVRPIVQEVSSQTETISKVDGDCQTDKEASPTISFPPSGDTASSFDEKAITDLPRILHNPMNDYGYNSPDPFASPIPPDRGDETPKIGVTLRTSVDTDDGPSEEVIILKEKIQSLSKDLMKASMEQEILERNNNMLHEKLNITEEMTANQGQLFSLKLKERSLLLKELSNQVNILRHESVKKDHMLKAQQRRITPGLSVPMDEAAWMPRGKGDITIDGTRDCIQPAVQRPPSAPGLETAPKDLWNVKLEDSHDAPRPKTANPPMRGSPLTYNTPATSLLKEASPIATRIKHGKVGGFTKGMHKSHSNSALKSSTNIAPIKNSADALREACNLQQPKMDMYSASGGKFGRSVNAHVYTETNEILSENRQDILLSSHDEIKDIRNRIGELLRKHEVLKTKNLNVEKEGRVSPGRDRKLSPSKQRVHPLPVRSRPTSPPNPEKFIQVDRLTK